MKSGFCPAQAGGRFQGLGDCLTGCGIEKVCVPNAVAVKRKKTKPRDRLPTVEEISAVKKHGDDFVKGVLDFIYITGCARRADICNLKRSEFSDTGYHPRISKTNKKGFIRWTPDLKRAVEMLQCRNPKYIMSTEYLVLGRDGKPLHVSAYNKRITKSMQAAIKTGELEVKFNPHDVRASHATEAERQGLDPSQQLLHGDRRTTEIYLRDRRETIVIPLIPPE
jgi:integrase